MPDRPEYILGVDLDGVVTDFYEFMYTIATEWLDRSDLPTEVTWNFPEWGLRPGEYEDMHRFAVTQRQLFSAMKPVKGAPQALRRLADEGVRIRIITHRLFIDYFHQQAVQQTVQWLDGNGVLYRDLCFMKDKGAVDADIYIEDSPANIAKLRTDTGKPVVILTNSTNRQVPSESSYRADDWIEAERIIRREYYSWLTKNKLPMPEGPGLRPH